MNNKFLLVKLLMLQCRKFLDILICSQTIRLNFFCIIKNIKIGIYEIKEKRAHHLQLVIG